MGLALRVALALPHLASAQTETTVEPRFRLNASIGPSFANEWLGLQLDYRTFFVHRDADTPRVHRVVTGLSLGGR